MTKGRFGPYLKVGDSNVKLPRGVDPLKISLEECLAIIEADKQKPAGGVLAEFGEIQVISGRYGPYLKAGGKNYRIPAGTDASALTEEDCRAIISGGKPTSRTYRKFKK